MKAKLAGKPGVRPIQTLEDLLWERAGHYAFFAEAYHWTQQQTLRENEQWYLDRLPGVRAVIEEIREQQQQEKDAAAKRKSEGF